MKSYREKLKDPRWQKLRLKVFERDNWKCTRCGNDKKTLHAHHEKYKGDPWDIDIKYLSTLCEDCHEIDRMKIKVLCEKWGEEGLIPVNYTDCPYFTVYNSENSCESRSGSSFCGGYYGREEEGDKLYAVCIGNYMFNKDLKEKRDNFDFDFEMFINTTDKLI